MRTIGAFEAKTHLSALLDAAEGGEEITITRHGRAVARLVPATPTDMERQASARAREAFDEIRRLRKGVRLDKALTVRQLIDDGRRF